MEGGKVRAGTSPEWQQSPLKRDRKRGASITAERSAQRSHLRARQDPERENKNLREECEITSDGCAAATKKKKEAKNKFQLVFN